MEQISRIGMDTSKHFFQLHGVNAAEKVESVIRLGCLNDANVVKVMCAPGMTLEIGDNYVPVHQIKS